MLSNVSDERAALRIPDQEYHWVQRTIRETGDDKFEIAGVQSRTDGSVRLTFISFRS